MKTSIMTRNKGQVYSVGNYLMNGKVLGKGHFARVEEATHRVIGKKVAIKIIDLTCIKEEYARRNLHREPKVMARLRHPCIAVLYETMMHGPRLFMVMEAAGGGDLCAHVLTARTGSTRGLPEVRARALSTQLVSAVRHMHARGVVHRDLKMENIMLDSTKQFIKIVDFGLSNVWSAAGGLRTPCGSLEYAAPELFLDGRRYGPEVDLWSIGVIVYGMVTGALPFGGGGGGGGGTGGGGAGEGREGGEGRSRPQLRAAIARGFSRKHRAALAALSPECKVFVQQLLEPNVETRMKIEEAARHRWLRKPGLRMKTYPLPDVDLKTNRAISRQISELSGQSLTDVVAEIKADPYGSVGGMYNIKTHTTQLQNAGSDVLWTNSPDTLPRPASPPIYHPHSTTTLFKQPSPVSTNSTAFCRQSSPNNLNYNPPYRPQSTNSPGIYKQTSCMPMNSPNIYKSPLQIQATNTSAFKNPQQTQSINAAVYNNHLNTNSPANYKQSSMQSTNSPFYKNTLQPQSTSPAIYKSSLQTQSTNSPNYKQSSIQSYPVAIYKPNPTPPENYKSYVSQNSVTSNGQNPSTYRSASKGRGSVMRTLSVRKPLYRVNDNGDCVEPRLPSIDEHDKLEERGKGRGFEDERLRLSSCPERTERRTDFYRRAGDGLPSWRATGATNAGSARILLQSNATTIKRASLGNIVSPHSSSNSHCKSERAVPVGWYSTRGPSKDTTPLQRLRRTAPIK